MDAHLVTTSSARAGCLLGFEVAKYGGGRLRCPRGQLTEPQTGANALKTISIQVIIDILGDVYF
jgi:hypothetical protein